MQLLILIQKERRYCQYTLTSQNIRAHYDVNQACDTPFELTAEHLTSPKLDMKA